MFMSSKVTLSRFVESVGVLSIQVVDHVFAQSLYTTRTVGCTSIVVHRLHQNSTHGKSVPGFRLSRFGSVGRRLRPDGCGDGGGGGGSSGTRGFDLIFTSAGISDRML